MQRGCPEQQCNQRAVEVLHRNFLLKGWLWVDCLSVKFNGTDVTRAGARYPQLVEFRTKRFGAGLIAGYTQSLDADADQVVAGGMSALGDRPYCCAVKHTVVNPA